MMAALGKSGDSMFHSDFRFLLSFSSTRGKAVALTIHLKNLAVMGETV